MIMIMKSLQGLDVRFQSRIASLKQISILNLLTNTSIYLLHSVNTRGKRSILYTPLALRLRCICSNQDSYIRHTN